MGFVKDRLRRTMLYIPGNNPGMMRDAYIYQPDSIMFDLEDSVKLTEKDAARHLVYGALTSIDYKGIETVVRINPLNTEFGHMDIEMMVKAGVEIIRLPKSETAEDVIEAADYITKMERKYNREVGSTGMMAAIESAKGVLNVSQIAVASERLIGIAIGAEDFVTDLKTRRYPDGTELLVARNMLLFAARAAGIAALDTVFSDINNEEGLRDECSLIKQLGFDGKSVINPRQIGPVHEIFTPTAKEIRNAVEVVAAIKEAEAKGLGVISLKGKMVDKPIVDRALRVLSLAKASGVQIED